MLTNDASYWKLPISNKTVDSAFRIHEGRFVDGSLAWGENVGIGTSKNRTDSIELVEQYLIHWDTYSQILNQTNGLFKLCLIEVK